AFLVARHADWIHDLGAQANSPEVRLFLARFDPASYTKTPQTDGTVLVEMHLPSDLELHVRVTQEKSSLKTASLTLAAPARPLLREQEQLQSCDVSGFFSAVQSLADWQPADLADSEVRYRQNSIAGGLAVLVIQHRAWLAANPAAGQWCFLALKQFSSIAR